MLIGANWAEDPHGRNAPESTWLIFKMLKPTEVRVKSNISEGDVNRLLAEHPGILWHIKMKGNKKWLPTDLNAREWSNEFNPIELMRLLISRGVKPCLELLNEVDVELTPDWQADNDYQKQFAIDWYITWASVCLDQLVASFGTPGPGGLYDVSLSSLSQGGPPERFGSWWNAYINSGLLARVSRISEHCYFPQRKFDDTEWGSRFKLIQRDTNKPIDITEANDNGEIDATERSAAFKDYIDYVWRDGKVSSISLFMLPGSGFDTPWWWVLSRDTANAIGALSDIIDDSPPLPELPTTPPSPPPSINPWEYWSAEEIATIAGVNYGNVIRYWPSLYETLQAHNIADKEIQAAAIGTIAIETASTFAPIEEFYSSHWATYSGGPLYHGRGHIQLTHDYNYKKYGELLGFNLLDEPWLALDPFVSALVLARYFFDPRGSDRRSVADSARGRDWTAVRRKVQGGVKGLERLVKIADTLLGTPSAPPQLLRVFPIMGYTGSVELHWGSFMGASDLFAARGQDVLAIVRGTVEDAGYTNIGGNYVLYHGDDGLDYYYAHGDRPPQVRIGQNIIAGTYFFGVGDTGNAVGTGPHLHIGIGYGILSGSGPTGGAGADFDAVTYLRALLSGTSVPPIEPGEDMAKVAELEGIIVELQRQIAGKDQYAKMVVEGYAHTADVWVPQLVIEEGKRKRRKIGEQVAAEREMRIGPKP